VSLYPFLGPPSSLRWGDQIRFPLTNGLAHNPKLVDVFTTHIIPHVVSHFASRRFTNHGAPSHLATFQVDTQRYVIKKGLDDLSLVRSLAIVWRLVKRARNAKKGEERYKARRPFNFTDQRTLPPQTELEQRIFDKMWNMRLGWDWKDTDQGKLFLDKKGNCIKEKELSKTHFDQFGRSGPWRDFRREAMAIYYSMKEPMR
jgi:hypothetical protein